MLRINEIAQHKGIALQELARRLGITYNALYNSINGNPTLERLKQIADALDVHIVELFEQPAKQTEPEKQQPKLRHLVEIEGTIHEITPNDIAEAIARKQNKYQ